MSTKFKYSDELPGKIQLISDLLPSPAELAFCEVA